MLETKVRNLTTIHILRNKEFNKAYIYINPENNDWRVSINEPIKLKGYEEYKVNNIDELNEI